MLLTKLSHSKISIIFFLQKSNDGPKVSEDYFFFSNEFSKNIVCFINFPFIHEN